MIGVLDEGRVAVLGQLLKATLLPTTSEAAVVSHSLRVACKRTQAVTLHLVSSKSYFSIQYGKKRSTLRVKTILVKSSVQYNNDRGERIMQVYGEEREAVVIQIGLVNQRERGK